MSLFRKFATVASGTMISRILGFIREICMASALGTGPIADAFNAAFRFPNSFRRLFAEGALSSAFVPLFAKKIEGEGIENAKIFASDVFSVLLTTLFIISLIAEITMPYLVRYIIAPGFLHNTEKYSETIKFAMIMFPYLGCMSLTAIICGMLNSMRHYFVGAIAPIFLNIILISVLLYSHYQAFSYSTIGSLLSQGVLLAGIIQLCLAYIAARRININIKLRKLHFSPEIKKMLSLALPAAITGGITQINLLINTSIASTNSGAISSLAYADRLYQLPLGIIGISIGTVLLPELSRALRTHDLTLANEMQNSAIEFSLFLALPAATILAVFGEPIICLLLQHGKFDHNATIRVSHLLELYGLGLPSFILIKALVPNYFARQDTKTPLKFASYCVILNIFLAASMFPLFSARGIAFAEISAAWLNFILLFSHLYKNKFINIERSSYIRSAKLLVCCLIMGSFLYMMRLYFNYGLSQYSNIWQKIITNGTILTASLLLYIFVAIMLKTIDVKILKKNLIRKKAKKCAAQ